MGYHRAGFTEIVGIDIRPQKRYPFTFVQGDALNPPVRLEDFDAIHASPPCQKYTKLKAMWNAREHPDLVEPTREMLEASGVPFVIENVPGAPLGQSVMLCGTMFGLGSGDAELRRHRYFELSFPQVALAPPCAHYYRGRANGRRRATIGVYGQAGGSSLRDGKDEFGSDERREAMGIDWMSGSELSQAIPPAFTEWIGRQLLNAERGPVGSGSRSAVG